MQHRSLHLVLPDPMPPLGVTRQSIIKVWIAERLERAA
jgi:hypothetical protein